MICAMLHAPIWLQIAVFLVVSAVALYFTRPLVKKYINGKVEPTNADMTIGKVCRVTETINNMPAQAPFILTARHGRQEAKTTKSSSRASLYPR